MIKSISEEVDFISSIAHWILSSLLFMKMAPALRVMSFMKASS